MSDADLGAEPSDDENANNGEATDSANSVEPNEDAPVDEHETDQQKRARLEAVLRRYRATLRNEADTGDGGFSADYYRSQKPPHW